MSTKALPEIIFTSDGFRTILNEPWECSGCHTMHYFFILTVDGHRCPSCAKDVASFAKDLPAKATDLIVRFSNKKA